MAAGVERLEINEERDEEEVDAGALAATKPGSEEGLGLDIELFQGIMGVDQPLEDEGEGEKEIAIPQV